MSSFAELEKDTEGTVYSSSKTKSGKSIFNSNISALTFIFRREIKKSRGDFSKAQTSYFRFETTDEVIFLSSI